MDPRTIAADSITRTDNSNQRAKETSVTVRDGGEKDLILRSQETQQQPHVYVPTRHEAGRGKACAAAAPPLLQHRHSAALRHQPKLGGKDPSQSAEPRKCRPWSGRQSRHNEQRRTKKWPRARTRERKSPTAASKVSVAERKMESTPLQQPPQLNPEEFERKMVLPPQGARRPLLQLEATACHKQKNPFPSLLSPPYQTTKMAPPANFTTSSREKLQE